MGEVVALSDLTLPGRRNKYIAGRYQANEVHLKYGCLLLSCTLEKLIIGQYASFSDCLANECLRMHLGLYMMHYVSA